ncbi:MAG: DPP IV N-terminal domain-containing protein, partial [Fimbriimonadaceae bacterium]
MRFGLALVVALWPLAAFSDFDKRYENALSSAERYRGLVVNEDISVNWLENGEFWYREERWQKSPLFWRVNPEEAQRNLLFDPDELASSLPDSPVDWSQFRLLQVDPELSFLYRGVGYTVTERGGIETVDLSLQSEIEPLSVYGPSNSGGAAVKIRIENASDLRVDVHWFDFEGESVPYTTLERGESWEQSSYAGHVWLIRHDEKVLAAYRTPELPATATFTGKEPEPTLQGTQQEASGGRPSVRFGQGLWTVSRSGETWQFEAPEEMVGLGWSAVWSGDQTHVAALEERPVETREVTLIESRPADDVHPRMRSFAYRRPGDGVPFRQPVLLDLESGERYAFELPELERAYAVDQIRFGPQGQMLFRVNERGHQRVATYAWRPGEAPRMVVEDVSATFVDYSQKSWHYDLPAENTLLKMTERTGWNHLERVDLQTGERQMVTEGDWVVREVVRVDPENETLLLRVFGFYKNQDPYHSHYARVGFDGTGFTMLTEADGDHRLNWSPNGDYFVATYSRVDLPPRHELRSKEGQFVMELGQA